MASRRHRTINLPAPYLRRVWLDPARIADRAAYPFCLPFLRDDFELRFDRSITIIVGENGTGKSTFLEGIAVLAGYDEAGGGKGCMPVDHSNALEKMGGQLSNALRASWLPKITNGWFFRAESFSRWRDTRTRSISKIFRAFPPAPRRTTSRIPTARVFCASSKSAAGSRASSSSTNRNPRCRPRARWNFLKLMRRMEVSENCQIIMATHSPMLMAYPGARLLRLTKYGLEPLTVEQTDHYKFMREFCDDPAGFVEAVIAE